MRRMEGVLYMAVTRGSFAPNTGVLASLPPMPIVKSMSQLINSKPSPFTGL